MTGRKQARAGESRYPMDTYDGGRAAAEPEHYRKSELGWMRQWPTDPKDEDRRALALAVIALTSCAD